MTIRVCLRRVAAIAAVSAAALMGIQDIAAQELEEIVVTARKRDESVLEIPISVSAFSQDDLDSLGMNTIEQLSTVTTGFAFQNISQGGTGGRHNPNIRFRGLGVQVESPASRAGSVFWNGGYISDGAGILPLIDLERVEVLKGPQTAFFGRNTFAGAVNYIPAGPGDEFGGKVSLSYSASDESSHNFTAAIGGPISDRVGVRFALMQEKVGADYLFDNGDPIGEQNNTAVTGLATFEVSESFTFQVSGFYVDSDDTMQLQSHLAPRSRRKLQQDLQRHDPARGRRHWRHFLHRPFAVPPQSVLRLDSRLGRSAAELFRGRQDQRQHAAFHVLQPLVVRYDPAARTGRLLNS